MRALAEQYVFGRTRTYIGRGYIDQLFMFSLQSTQVKTARETVDVYNKRRISKQFFSRTFQIIVVNTFKAIDLNIPKGSEYKSRLD